MRRIREMVAVTVVASFFLGTAAQALAYEGGEVKDGGTITGTIKFAGTPPVRKELQVTKDKEICGKNKHLSWDLIVGPQKGIENAVVRLIDVNKGEKWAITKATVDQNGCAYTPHVVVVPAGGTLDILNSDKRHLHIDLGKFRLTICPQVFVAETLHDLVIPVKTGDHEQLFEELGRLGEGIECPLGDPAGH